MEGRSKRGGEGRTAPREREEKEKKTVQSVSHQHVTRDETECRGA